MARTPMLNVRLKMFFGLHRYLFTFLLIALISALAIFATLLMQANPHLVIGTKSGWSLNFPAENSFALIATIANLLAVILSITITVVAIIVQLAANRYSHRITSLFVGEPVNVVFMMYLVVATVYCLWISIFSDSEASHAIFADSALIFSISFITFALILLLPYFAFVMSFLSPVNVIAKIKKSALQAITGIEPDRVEQSKFQFLNAIDDLQDITRRAVELSDRAVQTASINALHDLLISYQALAPRISPNSGHWFEISEVIKTDPDFVSLFETSIKEIETQKLWVETKILRQYLDLMIDSRDISRDISYLVAINTRNVAISSIENRNSHALARLCIQCFNSYLRSTINNRDARTCYYVMNQYRMFAEHLLVKHEAILLQEIAAHFKYYGILAYNLNLPFILEVAAEDLMTLIASCPKADKSLINSLLDMLLDLDQEVKETNQVDSLIGVRRAQLKLAVYFLEHGSTDLAEKICADMVDEDKQRLTGILDHFFEEQSSEYWEFTDRGVNFAYLPELLRPHLDTLGDLLKLDGSGTQLE